MDVSKNKRKRDCTPEKDCLQFVQLTEFDTTGQTGNQVFQSSFQKLLTH